VAGVTRTLHTKGAEHHAIPPSLRQRLLSRIVDPNIAYILFILGFIRADLKSATRRHPPGSSAHQHPLALLAFRRCPST